MNNSKIQSNIYLPSNHNKSFQVNKVSHEIISSSSAKILNGFIYDFDNEIIKSHLMKNKIYILCASKTKLCIYNIMKLKKIAEFQISNTLTFEKMIEILDKFDQTTLKSWFSMDVKLGVISLTFNENLFVNQYNFDQDFLEKVIEKTNSFQKNLNIEFKFVNEVLGNSPSQINFSQSINTRNNDFKNEKITQENFSNSMPNYKKMIPNTMVDKTNSCGLYLVNLIFKNYCYKISKDYFNFYNTNFWDTRDYLKIDLERFNQEDSNFKLFVYTTFENQIFIGEYVNDIPKDNFKMTAFLNESLQVVNKFLIIKF
jgi:hypothetical protein